jgi:hypothetical protein
VTFRTLARSPDRLVLPCPITLAFLFLAFAPKARFSMPRAISSVQRRYRRADTVSFLGRSAMRLCLECSRRNSLCVVHEFSESCEQCIRFNRNCDSIFPMGTIEKLARQENEVLAQISVTHKETREAEAKVARFRK